MYDSDEDPDRRRDKFARERRDDDRRSGNSYSRYDNGPKRQPLRRDDYPAKRSRADDAGDSYDPVPRGNGADDSSADDNLYSGPMLTFKKFLITQDDEISDEDAIKKYNEYKLEFKKHQLERFFRAHKEEEWFQLKYKPEESQKVKDVALANVNKRLNVFNELKDAGRFDGFTLDHKNAEKIIRTLDAVVVKLEDGSDEDLKAVLLQKVEDESVAEIKKEETGDSTTEKSEQDAEVEKEEGALDDENDKHSSKVNIHKTSSVFLRNIPPGVTHEELEALCKRSPGYLRLALSDVIPERKFYRRGWATFKRDVNIKEICWNLNAVRIRDTDLNAIINRDITRRIRTTNGITAHKNVTSNDLKLAVKLVALYDKRVGLFNASSESEESREKDIRMGVDLVASNTNPLLREIRGIVSSDAIEELSAEEAELLGMSTGGGKSNGSSDEKTVFERDEQLIRALDLLVLYLRIVHSIDFYSHGHYTLEDSMPTRCGMLHVRGQPPPASQFGTDDNGNLLVSNKFVQDFVAGFNSRIEKGLIEKEYVSEEEQDKLGRKSGDQEVEAFVLKNTVELAKEKWLCPLSGKKFKGPEFIRKHLESKHQDKLDEVRAEATFFNNYLADAARPVDIEPKASTGGTGNGLSAPRERESFGTGSYRDDDRGGYRSNAGGYDRSRGPPPMRNGGGGYGGNSRPSGGGRYFDDGGRRDRPQVSYRDLDAPEDIP